MVRINTRRTGEFYYDESKPPTDDSAWEPVWEYREENQTFCEEFVDNAFNDDGQIYNTSTAPKLIDNLFRWFG